MTTGPLAPQIIRFVIPLALTGILQQLFTSADLAVVGRFAGTGPMAAVGANAAFISLILNLFVGISLGANVVIAEGIGKKDAGQVERAVHTSLVVAVLGGIVLGILAFAGAGAVVRFMNTPADIYDYALKYLRVYLCGLPVLMLYNFEAAIFRANGNTQLPLIALAVSGVVNVGLNILFVLAFHMDTDGVALATVIANALSAGILLVALLRTGDCIRLDPRKLRVHGDVLKEILRIGIPASIQQCMFSIANILIQSAIDSLGTAVIAGSSAGFNVEVFVGYILSSYGQACATFTSQNRGAGLHDRCRKVLTTCLWQDYIATVGVYALVLLFSRQLLSLFSSDPEVIEIGRNRLFYIFLTYHFSLVSDCCSGYLRGYGMSVKPTVCNIFGVVVVRLTWLYTVFRAMPTFGVLMQVYPVSLCVTAIMHLTLTLISRPSRRLQTKYGD